MELSVGTVVEGKVKQITKFGAFILLPDHSTGMVHISEIAHSFVNDIHDHLTEGQTVMVLVIGNENCIHPAQKEQVGTRLAWLALSKTYGMKGIDADTPVLEKMEIAGNKACLTFRAGREGLAPLGDTLTGFEVAGADRTFHPASAWIEKGKGRLIVACDAVPEPVAVRYAFRNVPEATLFNTSGIPVSSFRTDDWEVK